MCSKCPLWALTQAERRWCHWLMAATQLIGPAFSIPLTVSVSVLQDGITRSLLIHKLVSGMAPQRLGPFVHVANLPGWRALRSADTNHLTVPAVKLSTIGSRAFFVSGPQTWNQLLEEITSYLENHYWISLLINTLVDLVVILIYLGHSLKFGLIGWLVHLG